jgi:glutamate racemase
MVDRPTRDAQAFLSIRGGGFKVKLLKLMKPSPMNASIGIFDSGVGGLSVLRALRSLLPDARYVYFADQAHVPYGSRPVDQVRTFAEGITRFLLEQGAEVIVVACNTASAAALRELRTGFQNVPFVGMEPAVKPAAEHTKTGVVGVLATPATFQGALYASVVERFANGVSVLQHTCPGLVSQIEKGELSTPETRSILQDALIPMLDKGIDTVVLGCTHYPFVIPLIEDICGDQVRVIDPAPAVARQTQRVLKSGARLSAVTKNPTTGFFTSGEVSHFQSILKQLIGETHLANQVVWKDHKLS